MCKLNNSYPIPCRLLWIITQFFFAYEFPKGSCKYIFLPLLIHLHFYSYSQDKPWTSAESGEGDFFDSILNSVYNPSLLTFISFLETTHVNMYFLCPQRNAILVFQKVKPFEHWLNSRFSSNILRIVTHTSTFIYRYWYAAMKETNVW